MRVKRQNMRFKKNLEIIIPIFIRLYIILLSVIMLLVILSRAAYCQSSCIENQCFMLTGIREATGNNDGPIVDLMLKICGLESTQSAYCGATNAYIYRYCGIPKDSLPKHFCWAPSWYRKERVVFGASKRSDADIRSIKTGYTVCLYGKDSYGNYRVVHVGILLYINEDKRGKYAVVFSGNTSDPMNKYNPGQGFHIVRIYLDRIYGITNWLPEYQKDTYSIYVVQRGDTLYRIAAKYNTTVNTIMHKNNLKSTTIWVGQKLKV